MAEIHPTAIISPGAKLGADVSIGPFSIIHAGVHLGNGTSVGSHCELGVATPLADDNTLRIGAGSLIRSHSVFYIGSTFGDRLKTGHRVTVREKIRAGSDLQLGTLDELQGDCVIGNHVKMHSSVHVGQKTRIHDYVWIFPSVVLTNDPHPPSEYLVGCTLHEFAAISAMSIVCPGVHVGRGAFVGAMTLVQDDVPADTICVGVPGRNRGPTTLITHKETGLPAYPWRRHFHRGYPAETVAMWKAEFGEEPEIEG